MMLRRQLPVHSPLAAAALAAGTLAALVPNEERRRRAARVLAGVYGAHDALLTDSGTSALVVALQLLAAGGSTVALPAYACIDVTAAARAARVRVRLYDIDPDTLGPDLASLERALERGVSAVVVAHLYGYPADVPSVSAAAARYGVPVIEDAAQGAGASLNGRRLGSFGALSILSFGRGKGMTAGGGGALLLHDASLAAELNTARAALAGRAAGWRSLAVAGAQLALGRPSLYAIPLAIPFLRLGEMVYHPASPPREMAAASVGMLGAALGGAGAAGERRREVARRLDVAARAHGVVTPRLAPEATPGFLRFVIADARERFKPSPPHGVLRGYPLTLAEHAPLQAALVAGEADVARYPGACSLRDTLVTLPTHTLVAERDVAWMEGWLAGKREMAGDLSPARTLA